MEIIRGLHNLKTQQGGCVATIGNFDGVHCGHQHILRQLVEKAGSYQLPSVVITFEPQPQEFFAPQVAPARLTIIETPSKQSRSIWFLAGSQ
mgnify:CR=1 FL=1